MRLLKEGAGDSAELLWVEEATPAEILAAARHAVESGTIEGEVLEPPEGMWLSPSSLSLVIYPGGTE